MARYKIAWSNVIKIIVGILLLLIFAPLFTSLTLNQFGILNCLFSDMVHSLASGYNGFPDLSFHLGLDIIYFVMVMIGCMLIISGTPPIKRVIDY